MIRSISEAVKMLRISKTDCLFDDFTYERETLRISMKTTYWKISFSEIEMLRIFKTHSGRWYILD